jgi:hypothetical protein
MISIPDERLFCSDQWSEDALAPEIGAGRSLLLLHQDK